MLNYRETAPPSALANTVECFWTANQESSSALEHRVLPDGCADLLFTRDRNGSTLQVVGRMEFNLRKALC